MSEKLQRLDNVIKQLDASGVHVGCVDKNRLREKYSVRRDGSNAFEKQEIEIYAHFVSVQSYNQFNKLTDNLIITMADQTDKIDKRIIQGKIFELKTKLQSKVVAEQSINGK